MKNRIGLLVFTLVGLQCFGVASATVFPGPTGGAVLLPANPTSADTLRLDIGDRTCGGFYRYSGNPYRVSMSQNNITVTLGEHGVGIVPLCPPAQHEEIDLGRLPAGNYTITVVEGPTGLRPGLLVDKAAFTISDARAAKTAPYTQLDYSGHWWDPNDSGWGLFIWQDARSSSDSLLAAWFSYTPDGKPIWYIFQPRWQTATTTFPADIVQASRLPGATSPPPTVTSPALAGGTATLDFTVTGSATEGRIIYSFGSGPTLIRNIQRFKP